MKEAEDTFDTPFHTDASRETAWQHVDALVMKVMELEASGKEGLAGLLRSAFVIYKDAEVYKGYVRKLPEGLNRFRL